MNTNLERGIHISLFLVIGVILYCVFTDTFKWFEYLVAAAIVFYIVECKAAADLKESKG